MKDRKNSYLVVLIVLTAISLGFGYWRYARLLSDSSPGPKVLYYQDSMHPWVKSDRPGKCTICAMDLTPILEGQPGFGSGEDVLTLSRNNVTALNVQTEEVARRSLHRTVRVAGVIEADNNRKTILAAPAAGRIDNVRVSSAGVDVRAGQVLTTLYSPELTFQTRRYIFRDRITDPSGPMPTMSGAMSGSSRHTPNPVGSSRTQPLPATERADADPFFNDLLATKSGTVTERNVFDGQYVSEGDRLFTIVDCSVVWFRFDVYEQQLPWLQPGQKLEVTVSAIPGKVFPATVAVIEPTLDQTTRTVKVRADVQNPLVGEEGAQQRLLRLGMYADGRLQSELHGVLSVPRGAILSPGSRAYAYVDKGGAAYEVRPVELGRQGDDYAEVLGGLEEGERVVIAGNVLIDAQAQFNRGSMPGAGKDSKAARRESGSHTASGAELTDAQHQAATDFLAVADGISGALASDSLEQLGGQLQRLPAVAAPLAAAFPADHPWSRLVEGVAASSRWPAPDTLEAARAAFQPFSTNLVELVEQLRHADGRFESLKVFFCPMAPKPGLWFQARNPLRNPYFGARMLHCGEEVPL